MDDPRHASGEPTDAELLLRSRDGDRHAFSELWRRHAPVAVAYARSLGSAPPDPEDVVSDAFLSILRLLRAGKGPETGFRPYLLTTVRNTRITAARRTPATTPLDDAEHPPSVIGAIDVEAMVNSTTIAEAFGSLPERWQHALWLSEVEQLPPRAIAEVLDLRPNSAAALTYRARDALRKAWIRAHLRQAPDGTDHARVIELLGAYAHDDLAPRSHQFVSAHLARCAACRAAAGEAQHLARAMTLGPLLAGGTGLVVAPLLFPAEQVAAATVDAAPGVSGWLSLHAPTLQPAVDSAGNAAPVMWPVAAAVAVALSVSGSLFVRPQTEPDATAAHGPVLTLPSPAVPAPAGPVPTEAPVPPPAPSTPPMADAPAPPAETPPAAQPVATPPVVVPHVAPVAAKVVEEVVEALKPDDADCDVDREHGMPEDDLGFDSDAAQAGAFNASAQSFRSAALGDLAGRSVEAWVMSARADADGTKVTVSVTGAAHADVLVVLDDTTVWATAHLGESGEWSGEFDWHPSDGTHSVSVHHADEHGAPGEQVARTVLGGE